MDKYQTISKEIAKSLKLRKYFTNKPCSRGHICERFVSNDYCIECHSMRKNNNLAFVKIYTVGFNSAKRGTGFRAKDGRKVMREYDHWRRMLQRSYDPSWKSIHQSYQDCEVSPEWWDYQEFAKDYYNCRYKPENSDLDKDLLFVGNKLYSKETCVYLPEEINKAIIIQGKVSRWHSRDKIFESMCNGEYIGRSDNHLEFSDKWVENKFKKILFLANKYRGVLDPRAYNSLINFKICVKEDGSVYRER